MVLHNWLKHSSGDGHLGCFHLGLSQHCWNIWTLVLVHTCTRSLKLLGDRVEVSLTLRETAKLLSNVAAPFDAPLAVSGVQVPHISHLTSSQCSPEGHVGNGGSSVSLRGPVTRSLSHSMNISWAPPLQACPMLPYPSSSDLGMGWAACPQGPLFPSMPARGSVLQLWPRRQLSCHLSL